MILALNQTTDTTSEHSHEGLGPYENWLLDVGKYYDLPALMLDRDISLSCIAEFKDPVDYDRFRATTSIDLGPIRRNIMLPTLLRDSGLKVRFVPFLLAPVAEEPGQKSLLQRGAAEFDANVESKAAANPGGPLGEGGQLRLNFPLRNATLNAGFVQADPDQTAGTMVDTKPKVILAIIDLGIPFAHANFRCAGGKHTRIDYCWAQSAPKSAELSPTVLFGREFTRTQIDQLIDHHSGDEDAIYRGAGLLGCPDAPPMPLDRLHSHGAHVLDTLAGRWDAATEADVRIIAVDLPASSTWETSGYGKDMFILSALHYIFDRAHRLQKEFGCAPLPLVINLSYGYSGGPHNGTGLIEEAIAELIGQRNATTTAHSAPTFIVMPSGNMFQDQLFAQITDAHFQPIENGQKAARLQWFAPPADRTSSYLECWYPQGTTLDQITVVLTPPNGPALPPFRIKSGASYFGSNIEIDNKIVGQFTIDRSRRFSPTSRLRAMVILAPTETPVLHDPRVADHAAAPAGLWTIEFRLPDGTALPTIRNADGTTRISPGIECRIQRDTSYGQGNTGAQQSYFIDPLNERYDAMGKLATTDTVPGAAKVRRFGSMNGMATSPATLVVGGSSVRPERAAVYSSAGGTGRVVREGLSIADDLRVFGREVDISAASERSAFEPGMVAAGTRTGVTVAFQGTSTSAPQVARHLGAALLHNRATDVQDCLALLEQAGHSKAITTADDSPAGQQRLGRYVLTTYPRPAGSEQIDP
jgi:hypothetical protein